MHFSGCHVTRYRYSSPVKCLPLDIRLKPRADYRQRLLEYKLEIDPSPNAISNSLDWDGNEVATAWFGHELDTLTISTSFEAETDDGDPFQFLLRADATRLPLVPAANEESHFAVYARPRAVTAEVEELVHELARDANFDTLKFVCDFNQWIYCHLEKIVRPTGVAWRPRQTLRESRGACRDLAVLFIEGCRLMNVPSRFVSGYSARSDDLTNHELHAWAEVFLPGGGWRGFDPSLGLAVTERHLAVAAGATPAEAAPTSGQFSGNATGHLETEVSICVGSLQPVAIRRDPH
jgi:transglutaminase-like putative cysteine protease